MRAVFIAAFLMIWGGSASAEDLPTGVTYGLGGVVSGPYRLSADLVGGTVSEATAPRGTRDDPSEVERVTLTPKDALALRRAAEIVWRDGADIFSAHYHAPDPAFEKWRRETNNGKKPGSPPPTVRPPNFSCNTMDAVGRFEIVKDGKTRTYDFSTPCMTPDAGKLLAMLSCKLHPERRGCPGTLTRVHALRMETAMKFVFALAMLLASAGACAAEPQFCEIPLDPQRGHGQPAVRPSGHWVRDKDASIDIRRKGAKLSVDGSALWHGGADNVHDGELGGEAGPMGDTLLLDGRETPKDTSTCIALLTLVGRQLEVEDNGSCGGMNVSFDGEYRRR